jgi:hypothetical protein
MGSNFFNAKANPGMAQALRNNDPLQIQKEIANFHKGKTNQLVPRRLAEAAVASGFIDATDPISVTNFRDLMAKNSKAKEAYQKNWGNWSNEQTFAGPDKATQELIEKNYVTRFPKKEKNSPAAFVENLIPSATAAELGSGLIPGGKEGLRPTRELEAKAPPEEFRGPSYPTQLRIEDTYKTRAPAPQVKEVSRENLLGSEPLMQDTVSKFWEPFMPAIMPEPERRYPQARITEPLQASAIQRQRIPEVVVQEPDTPQSIFRREEIKRFMGEQVEPKNIWRDSQGNPILDRFGGYIYQKPYD